MYTYISVRAACVCVFLSLSLIPQSKHSSRKHYASLCSHFSKEEFGEIIRVGVN